MENGHLLTAALVSKGMQGNGHLLTAFEVKNVFGQTSTCSRRAWGHDRV
jgi:hypothetical protein